MKKGLLGLLVVVLVAVGAWKASTSVSDSKTIRLCTWSNYFPDDLLKEFTKTTGIKVEMSYISSNEELFSKLRAGATGYDIIQPSDYMVAQMAHLGMLTRFDHAQLPHLSHVDPYYQKLTYDPGLVYSVPFVRGITGIIVDTGTVKLPPGEVGWDLLFNSPDPEHTSLLDDMREVFTAVMYWKGLNALNPGEEDLKAAEKEIVRVKQRLAMFTSEPFAQLSRGELRIAHAFSTHGIQAHAQNPKMQFFVPKEGGVIWTDNFAIPSTCPHPKEAHQFVDFFLRPEIAEKVIAFNGMASPNLTARERLPASERSSPITYPSAEVLGRLQFLGDLGPLRDLMSRLWTEAKNE